MKLSRPPRRVLVVCLRRLGDVLLCTALIRSLRRAWPQARIEVLVNASSAAALQGNPDIDALIVQPESPRFGDALRLAARILRRYDLAASTLYNDRPFLYGWLASRTLVSVVPPLTEPGAGWKRRLCSAWRLLDGKRVHAVDQYLQLADALEVPRVPEVVPPRPVDASALVAAMGEGWDAASYAVIHPSPLYRYKAWTVEGWRALLVHLVGRGLRVRLSGGPSEGERALVARILDGLTAEQRAQVDDLSGRLPFAALTPLIERCAVFVGPDTSVTHLAAATGAPVVALFGPSHPVAWGPWPQRWSGGAASPWVLKAPLQQAGNVWLVQGEGDCVPCLQEGCERRLDSRADCLDGLAARRVLEVVDAALDGRRGASIPIRPLPAAAVPAGT